MARPLRIEYPRAFYHVTSRGNERKSIFRSYRDREKFLEYLESATERYGAVIHVYCLMDNHYHLFIETPLGNLSKIMQHINGAYTMYFNTKRNRAGHLMQGRYKSILVDADEYAKELSRYIHLNPVRACIEKDPSDYEWSSCGYYTTKKKAPEWLKREFILSYFGKKHSDAIKKYKEFVEAGIVEVQESPLEERLHSVILGSQAFVDKVKSVHLKYRGPDRELPDLNERSRPIDMRKIEEAVDQIVLGDEKLTRQIKLYFCHRYTGLKLKEIGKRYGITESGITQASRRVRMKSENNPKFRRIIKKIRKVVKV